MRKFLFFVLFLFASITAVAGVHRVGTYNLRWPSSADIGEKKWPERQFAVYTMICDTMNYDVVALQEVAKDNGISIYDSLKKYIGDKYTFIKEGGVVLAYRTSKYNRLDKGVHYLKPSPLPKDWKESESRKVVWAELKDKKSGEIFVFGATHLDLEPIAIREGARVCAEKMREIAGDYPCIVTGDLNCEPIDRDPHGHFKQYFGNARELTKTAPKGSYYTFSSSMNPGTTEKRKLIDFLYVRNLEVESYWANNSTLGRTLFPSDHIPVMCEVTLLPKLHATTHVVTTVEELRQAAATVQTDEIIYLCDGTYNLGDSALYLANTCVMEGGANAVITGSTQLINGNPMISLEIRGLTFQDAACSVATTKGSIFNLNGNYLKLSDCTIRGCSTSGSGLIYAEDCNVTIDHCLFEGNTAEMQEGGISLHDGLSAYTYSLVLTNSTFINNSAYRAPAVYYTSKHPAYLANNSFVRNCSYERGCVALDAINNTADVRLVNNTFMGNRISTESSFVDYYVGGTAVWQEMASEGCLTMVNNTIVGNYSACWLEPNVSSDEFWGGAIQSVSGQIKLYNNIIAGNYSSCPGRGDMSLENPTQVVDGVNNVFSSEDNTNYSLSFSDFAATDFSEACQSLVGLLGGTTEDNLYYPPMQSYGTKSLLALSPLTTLYAGENIAIVDEEARSAATIGSDILNKGSVTGTLTTDQVGTTRSTLSMPGSMEVGQLPTSLNNQFTDSPSPRFTKVLQEGQLYIIKNNVRYNAQGMHL